MRKRLFGCILTLAMVLGMIPTISVYAMTAQDGANWALSRIGQKIDTDGYWGAQCKDFVNAYCQQNWGFTPPGHAKDLINYSYPSGWQKIKNTPDFLPQPGDIAVWTYGSYATYGHCGIIISANLSTFVSVDQNWYGANGTVGSAAAKVTHNYNGFWGVIRPKFDNPAPVIQPIHKDNNPHVRNGFFTFKNVASGKHMQVNGGQNTNEQPVDMWSFDGSIDQRFNAVHKGSGKYMLYPECSKDGTDKVVDILRKGAAIAEGQLVDLYTQNDNDAQLFYIWPVGNDEYVFEIAAKSGYVICPKDSSAAGKDGYKNGSQLVVQKYSGAAYQKWKLCNNNGKETTPNVSYTPGSYKIDTDGDPLNMRSGAATTYSLIGSIPDKTTLKITQVNNNWGYTSYNGTNGWVCLDFMIYTVTMDSISISKQPTKTSYFVGDNFDSTGLEISANYSNGQKELIGSGYSVDCDLNSAGTKTVNVTYNGRNTSFTVNVEDLQVSSISLYDTNITKEYYVGDSLISEEIGILVDYSNGVENLIKNGFTTDYDFSTPGTKTVTVSYGGQTTSYDVEVLDNISNNTPKIEISSEKCYSGTNATVDVKLTSNDVYDGNMIIEYNPSKVVVIDAEECGALSGRQVAINTEYDSNKIKITFAGTTPITSDGTIIKLTFKVFDSADGDAEVTIADYKLYNKLGEAVTAAITDGKINITEVENNVNVTNIQSFAGSGRKVVTADVSSDNVICYFAAYKNGSLIECDSKKPVNGKIELSVNNSHDAQFKFMVWNAAMKPLIDVRNIY